MVQQSIIDARNAPALTPKMQSALDALVSAPMTGNEVDDLTARLKRAIIERALKAEMGLHLSCYAPGEDKPAEAANHRNGSSGKTLITDAGPLRSDIPRDRTGAFEPLSVPKHGRRYEGFDDLILSMYARGMSVRAIRAHLTEMYQVEVSPDFIRTVTDEVMADVGAWQSRPLEPMYPVIFFRRTAGQDTRRRLVTHGSAKPSRHAVTSPTTKRQPSSTGGRHGAICHPVRRALYETRDVKSGSKQ